METLTISTLPVTIRVMEVSGKRLTMSVFKQIPEEYFFDEDISDDQRNVEYLGWVRQTGKYILFSRDGYLVKELFEFERMNSHLEREKNNSKHTMEVIGRTWSEESKKSDDYKSRLNAHAELIAKWNISENRRMAENAKYTDLFTNDKQIYIAI